MFLNFRKNIEILERLQLLEIGPAGFKMPSNKYGILRRTGTLQTTYTRNSGSYGTGLSERSEDFTVTANENYQNIDNIPIRPGADISINSFLPTTSAFKLESSPNRREQRSSGSLFITIDSIRFILASMSFIISYPSSGGNPGSPRVEQFFGLTVTLTNGFFLELY